MVTSGDGRADALGKLLGEAMAGLARDFEEEARRASDRVWARICPQLSETTRLSVPGGWWNRVRPWVYRPLTGAAVLALVVVLAVTLAYPRPVLPPGLPARDPGLAYYPPNVPLAIVDPNQGRVGVGDWQHRGLPAPPPFPHGFQVIADPYPVQHGQHLTLESEPGWPGTGVWLYLAPARDQLTILYDRKLPRDAILLGRVPLTPEGAWRFQWVVPAYLERGDTRIDLTDTLAYLVAVTDTGYLAATGMQTGPRRTLGIQPEVVAVGETLTITGSDYPPGLEVRLDISHESPDGSTDLQVTMGWVATDEQGCFQFTWKVPERLNWVYADGEGKPQDHWLTVGDAGKYSVLAVECPDGGPRRLLMKSLQLIGPR